ncbi:MAG: hypothetical protein U0031_00610 [Thermomicrobiales bacterium]
MGRIDPEFILLVNLAVTLFMTGLIWYTQIVAYPLFPLVGADRFRPYQTKNMRRTACLVIPPMLIELATTIWLLIDRPAALSAVGAWIGALLLLVVWISTLAIQFPLHLKLLHQFTREDSKRVERTNLIRAAGWTLRSALLLVAVARIVG